MQKHSNQIFVILSIAVLCLLVICVSESRSLDTPVKGTFLSDTNAELPLTESGMVLSDKVSGQQVSGAVLPSSGKIQAASASASTSMPMIQCRYYNEIEFMNSIMEAKKDQPIANHDKAITVQNIFGGGIVPHHLLAAKMIAEFFQRLSDYQPEIVVVVAPNHRRIGINGIHTSTQNWATPFGVLESDTLLTGKLITSLKASQNDILMEEEHSISALAPYIKYYLPETKIVPVLLHGNYTLDASKKLGKLLASALSDNPRTAVIASVDFSHYLDAETANKMDEITLAAIKSGDISAISMMGNDNLDSPPSIISLLTVMKELGTVVPEVISHDNSSNITGSGGDCTTSYYTILFKP